MKNIFLVSFIVSCAIPNICVTNPEEQLSSFPAPLPRKIGWFGLYTKKSHLIDDFWRHIVMRGLTLTKQDADLLIEEVRFHAEQTDLNEKYILNELLRGCKTAAEDNKKRIGQKWDFFELTLSSLFFGGGLAAAILFARRNQDGTQQDKIGTALVYTIFAFPTIAGAIGLYRNLTQKPAFEEKYIKYNTLAEALEHALAKPRRNIAFN